MAEISIKEFLDKYNINIDTSREVEILEKIKAINEKNKESNLQARGRNEASKENIIKLVSRMPSGYQGETIDTTRLDDKEYIMDMIIKLNAEIEQNKKEFDDKAKECLRILGGI